MFVILIKILTFIVELSNSPINIVARSCQMHFKRNSEWHDNFITFFFTDY